MTPTYTASVAGTCTGLHTAARTTSLRAKASLYVASTGPHQAGSRRVKDRERVCTNTLRRALGRHAGRSQLVQHTGAPRTSTSALRRVSRLPNRPPRPLGPLKTDSSDVRTKRVRRYTRVSGVLGRSLVTLDWSNALGRLGRFRKQALEHSTATATGLTAIWCLTSERARRPRGGG